MELSKDLAEHYWLFKHALKSVRFAKQSVFRKSCVKKCSLLWKIAVHLSDNMQVAESLLFLIKQVPSWRSVWVLYSLYCVLILPDAGEAAKARCGRELVADLEFVCGDRGFYRGESHPQSSSYISDVLYLDTAETNLLVWVKAGQTVWFGVDTVKQKWLACL